MFTIISKRISFLVRDQDPKKYLGRWTVDYCQLALDNKITYANEDNCGSCGNTRINERLVKITSVDKPRKQKQISMNSFKYKHYNEYVQNALYKRIAMEKEKKEKDRIGLVLINPNVYGLEKSDQLNSLESQVEHYLWLR